MSREFFEKMNKRLAEKKQEDTHDKDEDLTAEVAESSSANLEKKQEEVSTQSLESDELKESAISDTGLPDQNITDNSVEVITVQNNAVIADTEVSTDANTMNATIVVDDESNQLDSAEDLAESTQVLDTSPNKPLIPTYEERINQVLISIGQLFLPFKIVLEQNLPFTKKPIALLYKLAWLIGLITKFIALRFPLLRRIISGSVIKVVIILLIGLFLLGSITSRFINTKSNILIIENAVTNSTGYKTKINGLVKVSLLPSFSVSLHNVVFDLNNSNFKHISNTSLQINVLESDYITLKFSWIPMLLGHFDIKTAILNRVHLDIQVGNKDNNGIQNKNYQGIIQQIENKLNDTEITTSKNSQLLSSSNSNVKLSNTSSKQKLTDESFSQSFVSNNKINSNKSITSSVDNSALTTDTDTTVSNMNDSSVNDEIINTSETDTNEQTLVGKLVHFMLDKVSFTFRDLDILQLKRARINILDSSNHNLLTFRNVDTFIKSNNNILKLEGSYNFMNNNFIYDSNLTFHDSKVDFTINSSLESHSDQIMTISGYKDYNNNISGTLSSKKGSILLWLNQFIMDIDIQAVKQTEFEAKFLLSNNIFNINNIKLKIDDVSYSGNVLLSLSGNNRFAHVNLDANIPDATPYLKHYVDNISRLKTDSENGSSFLTVMNQLEKWKNQKLSILNLDYVFFSLHVKNSKLNQSNLDSFNSSVLVDLTNNVAYLKSMKFNNNKASIDLYGKLNFNTNNAMFNSKFEGSLNDTLQMLQTPPKMQLLVSSMAQKDDHYKLNSRIGFVKNRILMSNIDGELGKLSINDTFAMLMERSDSVDIVVNTQLKELNFDYLTNIYNNQVEKIGEDNSDTKAKILDLSDKVSLKISVQTDDLTYKTLKFKKAQFNVNFYDSGFFIDRMTMQGKYGGTAAIVFNSDINVKPMIVGHVLFDGLVVHFSELKNFVFSKQKIVGNVVLNGKLKFNSNVLLHPINNLSGDITVIKKERIELNRFANTDSLYMTISEKGSKNNKRIFVNDIYGTVKIKNNIIDLYPVSFLYILNNKQYRGAFQVALDLETSKIKAKGQADNSVDITKGIKFDITGDIFSPKISKLYTKKKLANIGKATPKEVDIVAESAKYATVANGINDKKSDTYFYKKYNKRSPQYTNSISKKLYQKDMEKIDKDTDKDLFLPEESNK